MHYRDLLLAHKAYHIIEKRAIYYDSYMQCRNLREWETSPSYCEIFKLFGFILSWDPHFQGIPAKFKKAYKEILPILKDLSRIRLETADFNDKNLLRRIAFVFDKIASCSLKYESTDASKILHVLHPHLFVMWDRNIRQYILGNASLARGEIYAKIFLPEMQDELEEAVETYIEKHPLLEKQYSVDLSYIEEDPSYYETWYDELFLEEFDVERRRWEEAQELFVSTQVDEEESGYVTDMPSEAQEEPGEIDRWIEETIDSRIWEELEEEEWLEEFLEEEQEEEEEVYNRKRAIALKVLSGLCDREFLPKIIDEYNYMVYTRPRDFKRLLHFLRKKGVLKNEDWTRLTEKLKDFT